MTRPEQADSPKLYAAVITYNAGSMISKCLDSLVDFDQVIVADGVYATNMADTPLSNDGTREIAATYSNVTMLDMPYMITAEKKNMLQGQSTHPNDILVYVDSDCRIVGDVSRLKRRLHKRFWGGGQHIFQCT